MKITNKYISLLTIILSFLLFTPCLLVLSSTKAISQEVYRLKKVVIDAGHGGKDFGAIGRKSREKDIVLNVALKVGKYIQDNLPDVEVIYTRDRDVFVPLGDRGKIANESGADLFISIHCNSNPNRS
ncbi:MAG: N-acetylmuramoyl-L-alanine amidase, partial [Bacteroidales bacterium]|nr:N-acetylmuramoyl-L-alanine amidase [Bacteroidales bacterium]